MKLKIIYFAVALCGIGSISADQTVQSVQRALKDQALYYGKVTGEKTAETTAAVRRYQIRNGLQVTGQLNAETLRSLHINSNSAAPSQSASAVAQQNMVRSVETPRLDQNSVQPPGAPNRQQEMSPTSAGALHQPVPTRANRRMLIAELQQQLISRGYYQGRADGRHGRRTALALRAFQFASGLPSTGHLDASTVNALGLSNADFAYFEPPTRRDEIWVPVTKFKHGKWEVKWKKHRGHGHDEQGDWAREGNGVEQADRGDD
jgi:peptidoglycan hydrolase-like protein with peptidoglycan-binding domain